MSKTASATCPVCNESFVYDVKPGTQPKYCSPQHSWKAGAERQRKRNAGVTERWCPKCEKTLPASSFSGPTAPYCKPHMAENMRKNRKQRPATYTRIERMRNYGISQASFDAMFEAQGKRCKICGRADAGKGPGGWVLDHDHACCPARKRSCGKCLRGVLCGNCNWMLGNGRDDPVVLRAGAEYILAYRARREAEGHINPSESEDAAVSS